MYGKPFGKKVITFARRYSTQLCFSLLLLTFLTVTVGEGQAAVVDTPTFAADTVASQKDGFLGKPQVFSGETIATGEIQQAVAIIYKVETGDTMSSIAGRYNLSVGSILDANHLTAIQAEKVKPGTQLIIPAEDNNTSLAWLDALNKEKQLETQKAEQQHQQQLAQQRSSTRTTSSKLIAFNYNIGDVVYVTTIWGSYNGGYPGQCTWYVNYKRPDLPNGMGNANQYLSSARAKGLPTGSVPRPGAVMVTAESAFGHVTYVEAVNGDSIVVTEMNYLGPGKVSRRVISRYASVIRGYIY